LQHKKWTYEQLNGGETFLRTQTGTNKFNQTKGLTGFGMPRPNVLLSIPQIDPNSFKKIPLWSGSNAYASQKGLPPTFKTLSVLRITGKR